jgi:hypothetical protein
MSTLTLQLPRGLAAFYRKKAKDRKVSVAALVRADLLRMNEFEEDDEYDGELEKEANSPEMEKLRAEYGVLTREEADRRSKEARNDPTRPTFECAKDAMEYLDECRKRRIHKESHRAV